MGAEIALVGTALGLMTTATGYKGHSNSMEQQRKEQEEAQRQKEAEERRREREKVDEARDLDQRRAAAGETNATLVNGGGGLLTEPEVTDPKLKLKDKFGE